MSHGVAVNLLAGVKFPTGKTDRLENEVLQARRYDAFAGPLTWGGHFSANASIDLPVWITNNGFQNVPDWRVHCGFTWRF